MKRIDPAFWMAPMAGVTDAAFRQRLRRNGCRRLVTEMVSAAAVARGNRKTLGYLEPPDLGPDLGVQLFGADPAELAEAALRAQEKGFGHVDFNMGCPVKKVVRSGSGAALLTDLPRAERCLSALRRVVAGTLSVKIRAGWDAESINCLEVGRLAEGCGVDLVTLHARTRAQGYGGEADWSLVAALACEIGVPVLGNGDVGDAAAALERLRQTGCAGVMIGRAALGHPWIFRAAEAAFAGRDPGPPPSAAEIGRDLALQLEDLVRWKGERVGVMELRKFVAWGAKGMSGAARMRDGLRLATDVESLVREMERFFGGRPSPAVEPPRATRREERVRTACIP